MPKPNRFARKMPSSTTSTIPYTSPAYKDHRFIYRTSPQHQSLFFTLPPEIRIQIYLEVLPRSFLPPDFKPLPLSSSYSTSSHSSSSTSRYAACSTRKPNHAITALTTYEPPIYFWHRGTLSLFRVCRLMSSEATPLFYSTNAFDVSMTGNTPHLNITFIPTKSRSGKRKDPWVTSKPLTQVKRAYIRLIRTWCLSFPTHHAAEGKTEYDVKSDVMDAYDIYVWARRRDGTGASSGVHAREHSEAAWLARHHRIDGPVAVEYRTRVLEGLKWWASIVAGEVEEEGLAGRSGSSVTRVPKSRTTSDVRLHLAFEAYPDQYGRDFRPDTLLIRRVRRLLAETPVLGCRSLLDRVYSLAVAGEMVDPKDDEDDDDDDDDDSDNEVEGEREWARWGAIRP